jgi:ferredoxin-NADP reductase
MAIPSKGRKARVVAVSELGADTRGIELDLVDEPALGFLGGQYIIVDSGLVLPNGKAVKRAYSLMGDDREQRRLELMTMKLPNGPGSGFMHELRPGQEIAFSGPWGKLVPSEDAGGGPTLVLATDTGITAALGLVRSRRMAQLLGETAFVWLRTSPGYFLTEAFVRARLPAGIGELRFGALPAIGDPARIATVRGVVDELGSVLRFSRAFISGDGAVNYALLDDLVAAGIPATRDSVESFFNMPKKSAAAVDGKST